MLPTHFLVTKVSLPPAKKLLVDRSRLLARLDGLLRTDCRLALVSAPAGFGKTTLVSAWAHQLQTQGGTPSLVAWLSLDEEDNDPLVFWAYVVAALQTQLSSFGAQSLDSLQSLQAASTEVFLQPFINDLAQIPGGVLVLDDFHLIHAPEVVQGVAYLLGHLPEQFHILMMTRADPALPLASLRGRGQLLEIRLNDLRFSTGEAGSFLNDCTGLNLTRLEVETLNQKTEGWAAGLQMAAVSLRDCQNVQDFLVSFSGSNRYILDYLMEEVLKRQPAEIQEFLLKTSIMETFCAPLCEALLPDWNSGEFQGAQPVLEYLENQNLFVVPLDEERSWYRYHSLFTDLLRKRFLQLFPGQMQLDLHARVSHWYEENGFFYQAVEHAFLSEDNARAARLIDETADYLLGKGEHTWLFKQIQKLPEEQIRDRLRLPVYQAAILASNGNMEAAEQCLQHLERYLPSSSLDAAERDWLAGRAASVRALVAICRGNIAGTQKYAQLAEEKLPRGDDSFWRSALFITLSNLYLATGDLEAASQNMFEAIRVGKVSWQSFVVLDAITQLGMVLWARGQLNKAAEVSQEGLRLVRENRLENLPMAGMLYLGLGFVLSEQNELDEAEKYIRRGLELCQSSSKLWSLVWAEQVWMRLLMARNDLPAAEAAACEADRMAQENQIPAWITSVNSGLHARIWVKMGRLDEAAQYLQERGICMQGEIQHPHQAEYHALASLFIARGEFENAVRLLERILAYYDSTQQQGLAIGARVLLALAFQAEGNLPQALGALDRALQVAEPEGFVQIFLNEGEPLKQLLGEALRCDLHPQYVRLLLARYAAADPEERPEKTTPDRGELSARELEVLRWIASGLTNKEIALKLGISLRTVKFHTTGIFTRLDVENRTQAVTRAQALGLL